MNKIDCADHPHWFESLNDNGMQNVCTNCNDYCKCNRRIKWKGKEKSKSSL